MPLTAEELIAFEDEMAAEFTAGNIKAPLHLAGGNEHHLINLFQHIEADDWICGTWRFHWHCLLKGVPRDQLKARILEGRSIGLCFPEQRAISSAIVGGIAPIALGLAWAIHWRGGHEKVWCFLGDMSATTGIVHECMKYAEANELPIRWIIEDNGIGGTAVDTAKAWGPTADIIDLWSRPHTAYRYGMTRPFVGIGVHIPL